MDSWVVPLGVGVMSICAVMLTVTMMRALAEFQRTARHVNHLLPSWQRVTHELLEALQHSEQILARADRATREIELVACRIREGAEHVTEHLLAWKQRTQSIFTAYFGNGHHEARSGSRRKSGRARSANRRGT